MFLPVGFTYNDLFAALYAVAHTVLQGAKKEDKDVIHPDAKNPPANANPEAVQKYWKEFVKKYKGAWEKYKDDNDREWACCVAIWINYCLKRKARPIKETDTEVTSETRDKLTERLLSARNSQLKLAVSLLSRGNRMGIISKFLKETFASIEEKRPGEFTVTTQRVVTLEKGVAFDSKQFRDYMDKCSFVRRAGEYKRQVKANTDVIFTVDPSSNKTIMIFKNMFTKPTLEIVFDIPSDKSTSEGLKTQLTKVWKQVLKKMPEVVTDDTEEE